MSLLPVGSPPTPPRRRGPFALLTVIGVVLTAGVGIALVTAGPDEESARAGIKDLWQRRYDAVVARDFDAYMSTVDPERVFLNECERKSFEARMRSDQPPRVPVVARVQKWGRYFQVWLSTQFGLVRAFARYDSGRWYLSEPYPSELGDRLTKEYAGVRVHYYAAEADLATAVGAALPTIMQTILPRAAEPPSAMFELQIFTLSDPAGDCFFLGSAERWGFTIITLSDVRLTAGYDRITDDTITTIQHELLHWLQHDHASRMRLQRPHWWVIEGWPTLIANTPTQSERRSATCTSPPTYDDLRNGVRRDASGDDVANAYSVAAMLIERVVGSSDNAAYWKFFDDFGGNGDPYLRATGSDGRTFYNAWLEEARRKYC